MVIVDSPPLDPAAFYAALLRDPQPAVVRHADGGSAELPLARYLGAPTGTDELVVASLLDGAVLDIGCGPGRMLDALRARGMRALGVDRSPEAVWHACRKGRAAVCCDVFGPVPGIGEWATALLVDGNVGIGGNPTRLLRRVSQLLGGGGELLVELGGPGSMTGTQIVRLECGDRASGWFAWAAVSIDDAHALAERTGLGVRHTFDDEGRWFACLV